MIINIGQSTWWQSFAISVRSELATFGFTNGVPRWKIWKCANVIHELFVRFQERPWFDNVEIASSLNAKDKLPPSTFLWCPKARQSYKRGKWILLGCLSIKVVEWVGKLNPSEYSILTRILYHCLFNFKTLSVPRRDLHISMGRWKLAHHSCWTLV